MDTQARHTRKSKSKRRDGFRGHVAAEPETALITDCETTMAAGPAAATRRTACRWPAATGSAAPPPATGMNAAAGAEPGTGPGEEPEQGEELEVYGDSAYGSGEARAAYRDAGHDTVIKPKPLRPAVPGGFTLDLSGVPQGPSVTSAIVGQDACLARRRVIA